jgi:Ca-activated chloride channel family protein
MIHFSQPEWLWLLALLPLVLIWRGRRGAVAAVEYSNVSLAGKVVRETRSRVGRWHLWLPLLAAALMIVGLARPQLVHGSTEIQASGIDIMLAVDISGSMQTPDFIVNGVPTSRVDIVKQVVAKFIEQRPNDRIGIMVFASAPYLVSPPTLDHDWLLQNLDRVHIGGVEDGTAIGSAIAASVNRLRDLPSKSKVIVLLTDGGNNMGKISPLAAAETAKAMGVKVYTIGAGTGSDVDVDTLGKIATETGALFFRASDTDSLQNIYAQINTMEKSTQTLHKYEHAEEMFAWAVVPALALLMLGTGLEQTRFRRLP